MSIRILTGYPTKDKIGEEFRKSPTDFFKKPITYYSPLTKEVREAVFYVFCTSEGSLSSSDVCDMLESGDANLIASVMDSSIDAVRLYNPVSGLPHKSQKRFAELLVRESKNGKEITIMTQSSVICDTIRLSVKSKEVESKSIKVIYFDEEGNKHKIGINENGGYINKPKGMFQEEIELMFMLNGE